MQNRDKASIEREAEIFTTKELAKVLARKDKEEFATFQQGEIALDSAAYHDSEDENVTTGTGKIITNNRTRYNRYHRQHHEKDPYGIKILTESLAAMGYALVIIQQWAQRAVATPSSLSGTFGNKSQERELIADAEYIYEGEEVSAETARLLNNRMARILRAQKELESVTDPEEYAIKKDLLDRLIERSGVRAHERIGYAFAPEKVEKLEKFFNPDDMDCTGMVCVFRPRGAAHDSRKMKIDVADQYDQDPTETIGEVDQGKIEARPIQPPGFHYVG